jgi:hypothetical protein
MSSDSLPMTIFKPFGYTNSRTVMQICCFWGWLSLGLLLHYLKYRGTKRANEMYPLPPPGTGKAFDEGDEAVQSSDVTQKEASSDSDADKKSAYDEAYLEDNDQRV